MAHLDDMSAAELARRISNKELSPVEVVESSIERISLRNPELNAVVYEGFNEALEAAVGAEKAVSQGGPLGPLHGVPTLIKDLFDFKPGWPATFGGIPSLRTRVVDAYCPFAERVEAAGAIILGKTNSPVMGFRGTCDNPTFGATRNPFDLERNSGGSSGGSAAAVADGWVPFAEGTDGGGSIRIPSAWCGVFGFQPSFGRVPSVVRPNAFGNAMPFLYEGPITRTVEDAVLVLNVLSGRDSRDPFSRESPELVLGRDMSFEGLRIGFSPDLGIFPVDRRVRAVVEQAVAAVEANGGTVIPIDPRLPYNQAELSDLWCRQIMIANLDVILAARGSGIDILADNAGQMPQVYVDWLEQATRMTLPELLGDFAMRGAVLDAMSRSFDEIDVLLTPTVAALPVRNAAQPGDTFGPTSIEGVSVDPSIGWCLTYLTNFTGHPAASIPVGLAEGLPVGMQVIGSRYGDEDVLRFCSAFESIQPWKPIYGAIARQDSVL
jgi:amidase/aspartyl-tRNA(Asn)/glutamyl-tRNA(Gln) amidotransferase subunit A